MAKQGYSILDSDMNDAVSEVGRCAKELGFRAVFLRSNPLVDHNWHDPYYEPLWDAIEESNLSLGFHESTGTGRRLPMAIGDFSSLRVNSPQLAAL